MGLRESCPLTYDRFQTFCIAYLNSSQRTCIALQVFSHWIRCANWTLTNITSTDILKIVGTLYITFLFFHVFDWNISAAIRFDSTNHYLAHLILSETFRIHSSIKIAYTLRRDTNYTTLSSSFFHEVLEYDAWMLPWFAFQFTSMSMKNRKSKFKYLLNNLAELGQPHHICYAGTP